MRRRFLIVGTLVVLLTALGLAPAYADDAEQQVVTLVNAERLNNGLAPLAVSPVLTQAARAYARQMATRGFFGHVGPDGSTFVARLRAAGYTGATYVAENLAAGQTSPPDVVGAWMSSPSHRANVLSSQVTEIGIGHVDQSGSHFRNYWVAEFGNAGGDARPAIRVSSRSSTRPPPAPPTAPRPSARVESPPARVVHAPATPAPVPTPLPAPPHSLAGPDQFDDLGRPLTGVIHDPVIPGEVVQYFQRAVLEWHPTNAPGYRIQRRLLGLVLYPGAQPPEPKSAAPPGPFDYFPFTPGQITGLGHFVANYTRSGQPTHFKDYFDTHGGVATFGYPKDEPYLRAGLWTQQFQAAVLQYHPEYDRDGVIPGTNLAWRYFLVQPRLLGEEYVEAKDLPYR